MRGYRGCVGEREAIEVQRNGGERGEREKGKERGRKEKDGLRERGAEGGYI